MRTALIAVQATTFVLLGVLLCTHHEAKLGVAQLLLAIITVLVYSA